MVHRVADCGFANAYVVEERHGILVIDPGSRGAADKIESLVTDGLGKSMEEVMFIAATHFHIDHINGLGRLLSRCPPATKVIFHHRVRDYLDGTRKLTPMRNWLRGCLPVAIASLKYVQGIRDISFGISGIPLPVLNGFCRIGFSRQRVEFIGGNGRWRYGFGFGDWEIVETPGHTEDSISFYNSGSGDLVSGDFILGYESCGKGKVARFYWDREVLMRTFVRIRNEIKAANIYPGHGDAIHSPGNALPGVQPLTL